MTRTLNNCGVAVIAVAPTVTTEPSRPRSGGYRGPVDLRKQPHAELVAVAEQRLGVTLLAEHAVRKRRSLGLPTSRGTWVRISVCAAASAAERSGLEATVALPAVVTHPSWYQGTAWLDAGLLWRAEETELITESAIQSGGILTTALDLSSAWWHRVADAVGTLATAPTARVATPHTRPITQQRVTETVQAVFPGVEAPVVEWTVAHADFSWVNLTATGRILDWEDWGLAPRGWDAATLWAASLAVPELAEQVQTVFAAELGSHTGQVCQLYACAELLAAGQDYAGPLAEPARQAAERLVIALT